MPPTVAPALLSSYPFTSCPDLFRASISAAAMAPMEMPGTSPGMTEGAHPGMTEEPVPSLSKEGVQHDGKERSGKP